jgi:hypothetical protein
MVFTQTQGELNREKYMALGFLESSYRDCLFNKNYFGIIGS